MRIIDAFLRGRDVIRDAEEIGGMRVGVIDDAACAVVAVTRLADGADTDENIMIWREVDEAAEALEVDVFAGRVGGENRNVGMTVEADAAVLEKEVEGGAVFADDVAPAGERLAGGVAHLVVEPCVFKNHRQAFKPLHLAVCQYFTVPLKDFDRFRADAFMVDVRMDREEIVVAADGEDLVLLQKVDAFTGGGAVADDVASA